MEDRGHLRGGGERAANSETEVKENKEKQEITH